MKPTLLLKAIAASLALFCFPVMAQDQWPANNPISSVQDIAGNEPVHEIEMREPVFSGGRYTIHQYISHYLYYPYQARQDNVEGTVYIGFEVNPQGKVVKIKSLKAVNFYLEAAAIWAISLLPDFSPAYQGHTSVSYRYTIPVTFTLLSSHMKCEGDVILI